MITRTVTVGSTSGLHARPAALFVKAAAAAPVKTRIGVAGKKPVNAASMLGVMSLGAAMGTEVTIETDDESAVGMAVLEELAALVAADLDAEVPTGDG
jgi:phosphocarrier protein HPr